MAERKGPEGEQRGGDPIESGLHQDRSTNGDERDADPGAAPADEGTELIDKHRESGSAESAAPQDDAGAGSGAEVLAFRQRTEAADEGEVGAAEFDDEPIDLTTLQDDDALLDALGGTDPDVSALTGDSGPSVEELLVAWRQDVDAAPIGDLVNVDTAATAIAEGKRPRRGLRRRHLVPVATAAAVLMITFTGVGVAARDAQPGDMLWGVAKVLYTDRTQAIQAATDVREDLNTAEGAVEDGRLTAAEEALRSARERMGQVDAEHGLSELRAAHASLTKRIGENDSEPSSTSSTPSTSEMPSAPPSPSQPLPPVPPTGSSTPPSSTTGPTEPTTSPSETSSSESSSSGWSFFPQDGSSSGQQETTSQQ
ncbi:anti-sigma-D factor RsdA [Saccharopolyspora griseoalba]|uniref:Anti-sigma-D factor RsdA n=1 Tax=Saccharopolyspora griseoalba TaxID=1431848 RepID=A0ABW2LH23_9PSEU